MLKLKHIVGRQILFRSVTNCMRLWRRYSKTWLNLWKLCTPFQISLHRDRLPHLEEEIHHPKGHWDDSREAVDRAERGLRRAAGGAQRRRPRHHAQAERRKKTLRTKFDPLHAASSSSKLNQPPLWCDDDNMKKYRHLNPSANFQSFFEGHCHFSQPTFSRLHHLLTMRVCFRKLPHNSGYSWQG